MKLDDTVVIRNLRAADGGISMPGPFSYSIADGSALVSALVTPSTSLGQLINGAE